MHEFMLMMAKHMPEDVIIKQLKAGLDKYIDTKSQLEKRRVQFYSMLLLARDTFKDESIEKVMKEMAETEQIRERMNSTS